MKPFFVWLVSQAIFARILLGMALMSWQDLHLPSDSLGYFILPATLVCLAETITSGIVVYPLIMHAVGYKIGGSTNND